MNNKENKNLIFSFIAPYLLIVIIVFVALCLSNTVVLNAFKENVTNIIQNSFESNVEVMEQNLGFVRDTAATVAENMAGELEKIDPQQHDFFSAITKLKNKLGSYFFGIGVVKDICIQNDNKDILINLDVAYSKRINYYSTMVKSDKLSAQELLEISETANGFNTKGVCSYEKDFEVIPFVVPTPVLRTRTGCVSVYIAKKELLMPMREMIEKSKGTLLVYDKDGECFVSEGSVSADEYVNDDSAVNSTIILNGEKNYVIQYNGKTSGWKYLALLPESYVLSKVRYYQIFSLVINFIILILGFAICLFFAIRKSKSFRALIDTLGISFDGFGIKSLISKDEFKDIRAHISKIKDENALLLEKGTQNILRRILSGQIEKESDIKKELANHKIELSGNCFAAILIRNTNGNFLEKGAGNYDDYVFFKVCEIIENAKICFIDKHNTAVLFAIDAENFKNIINLYISRIKYELFKYQPQVLIGVGNPTEKLSELSSALKQANEVVEYKFLLEDANLCFYDELPNEDENYYYPLEIENELFKSVLDSDFEMARNVLRKIQTENFGKKKLCISAIEELLAELRASIKKICRLQAEYLEFNQEKCSVNHFFEYTTNIVYMLCSDMGENETQSRSTKLCKEIINYIELHYGNYNLSLDMLAREFRIHPNYLSGMFKKQTGNNLITYIEKLRIEKAAQLLSEGKYTVNEVSESVGFTNTSTFRRSFKKVMGVPPSMYLKY